jgi:hypothetical protein
MWQPIRLNATVVIVPIYGDSISVRGLLHPEPYYPFDYTVLSEVPFLRLSSWPIVDSKIQTEWINGETAAVFDLMSVQPTNEENWGRE